VRQPLQQAKLTADSLAHCSCFQPRWMVTTMAMGYWQTTHLGWRSYRRISECCCIQ